MVEPSFPFASLCRPLTTGTLRFRNRMVMAPMCAMYAAPDGSITPRMVEYYRARARGGAALVIVEITFTDSLGSRAFHAQAGAHDDRMIPGLNELAEAIGAEGAVAGLQLGHCGPQRVVSEPPVVAASPIPWAPGKRVPEALTIAAIEQIVTDHAEAARRLVQAGFELVELHGAHGYLINSFLSPATNRRDDAYGGTVENRLRFPIALVNAVKKVIGPDRLLSMRINGDDMLPGGLGIDEYARIACQLADAGVDLFHVSAGTYRSMERRITPMYLEGVDFSAFAAPIRNATGRPVIASGSIHDIALANSLLDAGDADLVSFARPLFADPDLPGKVAAGRADRIRPCIRCNTCVSREQAGWRGLCAVNPSTGHEFEVRPRSPRPVDVAVIGAGPAGIQAALTAAARGHRVRLLECDDRIGGMLALAAELPFKKPLIRLLEFYLAELRALGVELQRGRRADPADIDAGVVIEAVGARWPIADNFRNGERVVDAVTALRDPSALGARVAIVGAGTIGAEIAWHLATLGRRVTLIERRPGFGTDVNLISSLVLPAELARHGVDVRFGTTATGFGADGLAITNGSEADELAVDSVVLTVREGAPVTTMTAVVDQGNRHWIGECAGLRGLLEATRSGHRAALSIDELSSIAYGLS